MRQAWGKLETKNWGHMRMPSSSWLFADLVSLYHPSTHGQTHDPKTPKFVCYGSSDSLPGYSQQSPKPGGKNLIGLGKVSVTQHRHEYLIYVDKEER